MKVVSIQISPGHNYFGHHGRPPGRHELVPVAEVECVAGRGLQGDRFFDYRPDYPGQITFFAEEVHAALLRELRPSPFASSAYRRNVVTRGVDLNSLIDREFTIQGVTFRGASECTPCYWMDQAAIAGAEDWLRGRAGLRARILTDGKLRVDCPPAGGVLLAGGRSLRMGRDKAGLPWAAGTLGDHQAGTLAQTGCWPLFVSCRKDQLWTPSAYGRIEDPTGESGTIEALIHALEGSPSHVTLMLAVDLPHMPATFLGELAGSARDHGISAVPLLAHRFEPLAAAWHRSALGTLHTAVRSGFSLHDVCTLLQKSGLLLAREVSTAEAPWFKNINTPADLGSKSPFGDCAT